MSKIKTTVKYDLPVLIAFFVYSYAKLRLLEFYYDFLVKVLDNSDFQLVEMDTGSQISAFRTFLGNLWLDIVSKLE